MEIKLYYLLLCIGTHILTLIHQIKIHLNTHWKPQNLNCMRGVLNTKYSGYGIEPLIWGSPILTDIVFKFKRYEQLQYMNYSITEIFCSCVY